MGGGDVALGLQRLIEKEWKKMTSKRVWFPPCFDLMGTVVLAIWESEMIYDCNGSLHFWLVSWFKGAFSSTFVA